MIEKVTIGGIIKTSIVTAFTLATALIWKEVIVGAIERFFPADALLYEFLVAIFSTILIVIIIYLILEAEEETEVVLKRMKSRKIKK